MIFSVLLLVSLFLACTVSGSNLIRPIPKRARPGISMFNDFFCDETTAFEKSLSALVEDIIIDKISGVSSKSDNPDYSQSSDESDEKASNERPTNPIFSEKDLEFEENKGEKENSKIFQTAGAPFSPSSLKERVSSNTATLMLLTLQKPLEDIGTLRNRQRK